MNFDVLLQNLKFDTLKVIVRTFHLIDMKDNRAYGLLTWTHERGVTLQIGIFDLATGVQQEIEFPVRLE